MINLSTLNAKVEKQNLLFTILDNINRPQYGIANVINDAVDGDGDFSPLQSFLEGITLEEKKSIGDAITELGWEPESKVGKVAKFIVGFTGDVLTDPLTYVTGGLSAVSKGGKVLQGSSKLSSGIAKFAKAKRAMGLPTRAKYALHVGVPFGKKVAVPGSEVLDPLARGISTGLHKFRQFSGLKVAGKLAKKSPIIAKAASKIEGMTNLSKGLDKFTAVSNKVRPSSVTPIEWDELQKINEELTNMARSGEIEASELFEKISKRVKKLGIDKDAEADVLHNLEQGVRKTIKKKVKRTVDVYEKKPIDAFEQVKLRKMVIPKEQGMSKKLITEEEAYENFVKKIDQEKIEGNYYPKEITFPKPFRIGKTMNINNAEKELIHRYKPYVSEDTYGLPNKVKGSFLHGTHGSNVQIDESGNLALKASSNFGGKQQGVSFTEFRDSAKFYGEDSGRGLRGINTDSVIIEIKESALPRLTRESDEELFLKMKTNDVLKIKKGDYSIHEPLELAKTRQLVKDFEKGHRDWIKTLDLDDVLDNVFLSDIISEIDEDIGGDAIERTASKMKPTQANLAIVAKHGAHPDLYGYNEELARRILTDEVTWEDVLKSAEKSSNYINPLSMFDNPTELKEQFEFLTKGKAKYQAQYKPQPKGFQKISFESKTNATGTGMVKSKKIIDVKKTKTVVDEVSEDIIKFTIDKPREPRGIIGEKEYKDYLDKVAKYNASRYAGKLRDIIAKRYKKTFGKDLSDDEYKHITHLLAAKHHKGLAKEFLDEEIGRNLKGYTGKIKDILTEKSPWFKPKETDHVINLATGSMFSKGKYEGKMEWKDVLQLRKDLKAGLKTPLHEVSGVKINKMVIKPDDYAKGQRVFAEDIAEVLTSQFKETQRVEVMDAFVNKYVKAMGQIRKTFPDKKEGLAPLSDEIVEAFGEKIPDIANTFVPTDVARHMNKTFETFKHPEKTSKILKIFDKVQNTWKGTATFWNPAFHTRNFLSNFYQNFLADVGPWHNIEAAKIKHLFNTNPTKLTLQQKKWYKEYGQQGLEKVGQASGDINLKDIHKWVGANNPGAKIGRAIEDNAKLAHFIAKRKAGESAFDAGRSVKKYLFDYEDLTELEKKVFKRAFPFYCVPDDGEILTDRGWKKVDELIIGKDNVVVYDHNKDFTKFEKLNKVAVFDYNGELMSLSDSRNGNFLFTPNHGWPVIDHNNNRKLVKGYKLRSNYKIPLVASFHEWPKDSLLSNKEASVLGWVLTDGYIDPVKKRVCIYQSKKEMIPELKTLLENDASFYIHERSIKHQDMYTWTLNGDLKKSILRLIPNKHDDAFNILPLLNKNTAKILVEAMYKGDGTISVRDDGKRHCRFFSQEKGAIFDFFQTLTLLLGEVAQQSQRGCYIRDEGKLMKIAGKIGIVEYKGRVWCPELNGKCWYLRRNGKVILTQNTWTRKNIPLQLESLVKTPSKPLTILKAKNNIEIISGDDKSKHLLPDWFQKAAPVFIGRSSNGNVRYMKLEGLIPLADVTRLTEPVSNMIQMFTPVLKAPTEQFLNYNFFFGSKITGQTKTGLSADPTKGWFDVGERDFLNTRIPGRLEHLARLFRPLTEIEKLFGRKYTGKDWEEKTGRFIIGSVIYSEDPRVLLKKFNRLTKLEESNIIRQINYLRAQTKKEPKRRKQNNKDIRTLRELLLKAKALSRGKRLAAMRATR